jgi:signal transduction histidine kinase/DNA-binding response OmpR family regulator
MHVAFGEYQLDTETRILQREGRRIAVQSKAFDLLAYLIERRERVVYLDELLDALWPGLHVTSAVLSTAVEEARQAVGDDGDHQTVLYTERGEGLRFIAEVSDPAEPESTTRVPSRPQSRWHSEEQIKRLNFLMASLLEHTELEEKARRITAGLVDILDADFARIWLTRPGDLCESGCIHAAVTKGPHVCRHRDRCLHLIASSGRYRHTDGEVHRRVPFGCYKIGQIAAAEGAGFLTNDVVNDPRVHDHEWARRLGLVSFAGYRLLSAVGAPIGVLALFCKHELSSADITILEAVAGTASHVVQTAAAEEESRDLERQVRHAQKLESLGVLAGGIAHDFNNILMTILLNAELALTSMSPDAPASENLKAIDLAARRAAALAKQMLAYSGKGSFAAEPIRLNEFVEELVHMFEVSIAKKATLKFDLANDLPVIEADPTQIRQILMNLITNASEAIDGRSGIIAFSTGAMHCDRTYLDSANAAFRLGLDEPLPEHVYVYFEVADTGCGMDEETLDKLFDPFFTTKFTGRGLGMAAALGIVRGHRGAIKIYSEPGKGTTIRVLFPASESDGSSEGRQTRERIGEEEWRGEGTILVADDEEDVRTVIRGMLEKLGFHVLLAADGRSALEIFRDHGDGIVCVLLDLTMPHLDGEQAFREMRRIRPDVKVILSSGYNEQEATQPFAGKGLTGFIQKPYQLAAFRAELRNLLRSERVPDARREL